MDALKSLIQPLSSSAVGSGVLDATKLVILGGTVETARRVASSGWNSFVNSFFLTAHFSEEDYPYDWLLLWLQNQPAWSRSREFETTTCTVTATGNSNRRVSGDEVEDDVEDVIEEDDGRPRLKVLFQPTSETTHTIYYKGHWLRIKRSKKTDGSELNMLSISVVARSNSILKQLVLQAKKEYEQECVDRVQIYFADQHGSWRWTDSRHKRPLSSIVLNPGVIEMLLADSKDFLRSEKWYANRGIPYRRGYLLHGTPGSGKSSLIHALAGELALDVYVVSLSASWVNDSSLTSLLGRIPARSILLLEDIDAAFTRSTSRDVDSTGAPGGDGSSKTVGPEKKEDAEKTAENTNTLTLSGLLNALDGMQASESRILFCTTNHLERLDPALSRPGRMDVWIEFRNASKHQAEGLFKNFFPAAEEFEGDIPISVSSAPASSAASSTSSAAPTPAASTTPSISASASASTSTTALPTPQSVDSEKSLKDVLPSLESASSLGSSLLDGGRLAELAKIFAEAIPDEEFSVAELQGYLLKNKARPEEAARNAPQWVIKEREQREKLAREKEEKEERERALREKRRKEREEKKLKEAKEKEEKDKKEKDDKEKEEKEEKEKKEKEEKEKKEKEAKEKAEAEEKARKEKEEQEKAQAEKKEDTAAETTTATATTTN